MTKIYKLLIESPEYPKGTEAKYDDFFKSYTIWMYGNIQVYTIPESYTTTVPVLLKCEQIENRPLVWELIEEKLDLRSPEAEKMREESRATRFDFIPKDQCHYYVYDFENNCVYGGVYWRATSGEVACWNIGFVKSTRDEAMKHGEKYARYFLTE